MKFTNDSLGHLVGDNLIKNIAKILQLVFGSDDVISRTGGDAFVIIVEDKTFAEVEKLFEKLQMAINQYNEANRPNPIEVSIGLAYSETSLNTMEVTFEMADCNMYRNKKKGIILLIPFPILFT